MAYWVETLVTKAREYVQKQMESDPSSLAYWVALDNAIVAISKHEASIVAIGYDGLRRLLAQVGLGGEPEAVLATLQVAGPDEITVILNEVAGDLEADTKAKRERMADLLALLKELGQEGAKLALTLLVGLLAA